MQKKPGAGIAVVRRAAYTVIEQAQPPGPHPPHPPAPAMALDSPSLPVVWAAKTESCLEDSPSHRGQEASSSIRLMGRSLSKRWPQEVQAYSYMGMVSSSPQSGCTHTSARRPKTQRPPQEAARQAEQGFPRRKCG